MSTAVVRYFRVLTDVQLKIITRNSLISSEYVSEYISYKNQNTEKQLMKIQETFPCSEHHFTFVFLCYQNQTKAENLVVPCTELLSTPSLSMLVIFSDHSCPVPS